MPDHPGRASFITALSQKQLAGFVHVESLFHFNCVYVTPEHEHTGLTMRLIRDATACIPEGFSALWMTDRNVGLIARTLGWRHVGTFSVYRKDR